MAKKYEFSGYLTNYERCNSSIYGNPRYWGEFTNKAGESISGKTRSDASCGYGFLNQKDKKRKVCYHYTKKGNVIIDTIEILQA